MLAEEKDEEIRKLKMDKTAAEKQVDKMKRLREEAQYKASRMSTQDVILTGLLLDL